MLVWVVVGGGVVGVSPVVAAVSAAPQLAPPVVRPRPGAPVVPVRRSDVGTPGLSVTPVVPVVGVGAGGSSSGGVGPDLGPPRVLVPGGGPVLSGPVELVGKRTEFSKVVANPDGSKSVSVSPERLNFKAPDGSWQPIDTHVMVAADGSLVNVADSWHVSFSSLAKGGVKVTAADGGSMSFRPEVPADVLPVVSGDGRGVVYREISAGLICVTRSLPAV